MRFRVMGTEAHVVVVGDPALEGVARRRLADLERRWSRFIGTSELSRLNATPGVPVVVSTETFEVVAAAVESWWATAGRFDPTVHDALVAAGYDRSFDELEAGFGVNNERIPSGIDSKTRRAPGCAGIGLDPGVPAVTLPAGVRLDLGGIGKGCAADLVVAELLAAGAHGACVNVGGDLRAEGEAPTDAGWVVAVEDKHGREQFRVALAGGAVATSTIDKRRWVRADGTVAHHLIDPSTGQPCTPAYSSVTVIAGEAWRAEVLAKVALLAPAEELDPLLDAWGASAMLGGSGALTPAGDIEPFVA